jgi:hypothetical protein
MKDKNPLHPAELEPISGRSKVALSNPDELESISFRSSNRVALAVRALRAAFLF